MVSIQTLRDTLSWRAQTISKKFITQRELDFISNVTKELVQDVVEEEVKYYAIELDRTKVHRLYEESINKVWSPPVRINALVLYDNPNVNFGLYGADDKSSLAVYFHVEELKDRNVSVRTGDFVEYGDQFYEILGATEPQLVFGQINNKVMVKCTCAPAREGQFQAGGDSLRGVDNAVPIENSPVAPPFNRLVTLSGSVPYAVNPLRSSD